MEFKFARISVPFGWPEYQGPYVSYQGPLKSAIISTTCHMGITKGSSED